MTNSRPRILIIYPYSSLDTNPTMTFLLESLAKRKVWVDVLAGEREAFATPESFLTPESFGNTIRVEFLPFDFFFASGSLKRLPLRMARRFLRAEGNSNYPICFDPAVFKFLRTNKLSYTVGTFRAGPRVTSWPKWCRTGPMTIVS